MVKFEMAENFMRTLGGDIISVTQARQQTAWFIIALTFSNQYTVKN